MIALITVVVVAGCKSSGPTPQPQPTPSGASVARTIDGRTVKADGTPADDDGDHCFRQDNSRDLVLTVKAPEVKNKNGVFPFLIDKVNGPIEDQPDIKAEDGTATITYHADAADRKRHKNLALPMHLGPGPYVATVTIVPQVLVERNQAVPIPQPITLAYPYITYHKDKKECLSTGSQIISQKLKSTTARDVVPKVTALHAYTNKIDSDREHCFYSDPERPLYVDAYTDIPVDNQSFAFALYSMTEGNYVPMTFNNPGDLVIKPTGNVIHIMVNNSSPPHLGPGPYMAMISAQSSLATSTGQGGTANAKYSAIGYYFYETWPQPGTSYSSDCWYRQ
jgi:hypothetical protein